MTSGGKIHVRLGYKWIVTLLFAFAISLLNASEARADERCVADLGGVIDGFVTPNPPAQIQIDGNCIIRNFPASNPLRTNFSFYGNNPTSWLVVFDNVIFTGNMSCNLNSQGNRLWFTNGSSSTLKDSCLSLLIPVEKINKQNPPGPPLAYIGVPFTYKLTIPTLFDPATGVVVNTSGSPNDLHGITVWDNLNATGVDLTYVSHVAHYVNGGAPIPHTFSNVGGQLTFDNFPVVTAGQQFVIEVTVVLNATATNVPGKQFINTAKWDFGRRIDGVYYEPLPGEWGVTPPMTIAVPPTPPPAPAFRVQKISTDLSGDPNLLLPGETLRYTITVKNIGNLNAANVVMRDAAPANTTYVAGSTTLNGASVADVGGLSPLVNGMLINSPADPTPGSMPADASTNPSNVATITFDVVVSPSAVDGTMISNQALVTAPGNINQPSDDPDTPTNNDPTLDRVTVVAPVLTVTKSGPATMNLGQWGDFSIDVQNTGGTAWNATIRDLFPDGANGGMCDQTPEILSVQVFAADGVTPIPGKGALNAGTGYSLNYSAAPTCRLEMTMLTAEGTIGPNERLIIRYRTKLDANTQNGVTLTNVAGAIQWFDADSSNPNRKSSTRTLTNGTPSVVDHEDDHTVTASAPGPVLVLTKSGPATMSLGQWGDFDINVQNTGLAGAWNATIRDLLPDGATGGMCDLTPEILSVQVFAADGVTPIPGKGALNAGTGYSLNYSAAPTCQLEMTMLTAEGTIGPNERLIIRYRTKLDANTQNGVTLTNVAGAIQWFDADSSNPNRKSSTRTLTNGTPSVVDHEDDHTVTASAPGPVLVLTKSGPATMSLGQWGDFDINVQNTGLAGAWNATIRDLLPDGANGGMCDLTPEILSVQVFAADGVTPIPGKGALNAGTGYSLNYSAAPTCRLEMTMLTAEGTIGPNERLIIRYRTKLDANTQNGVTLTNVAGAIQWFDADSSNPNRKSSTRNLTNGTPTVVDHEDDHTVTASAPAPVLVLTKSGPATMNLGQWGDFDINVQNTGLAGTWNATIRDLLPDGATGGMCDLTPEILSVQVFAADGVTPIPGKGALNAGTGYSLNYNAAPNCQLEMTMLTAEGTIGPNERLIIRYRTKLDANTQNGVTLTNVAGAIQWFDADSSNPNRKSSTRTLTNGTPSVVDHEDDHTVTASAPGPVLVLTKSGPATMSLGQWGDFDINVQNTGLAGAWNATIRDLLPDGATGGMCDLTPEILSVQVFAADGVTPIPGKGALNAGTGYSLNYNAAPTCQLEMTMLTAEGTIGPNERLIIRYRTKLDANTQNGVTLTNVAGAIQWFDADSSNPNRKSSTRNLTNGTPTVVDHEDDHTVTVALSGYFFEKSVEDLTSGANPAVTAAPGDKLRYTLRFRTTTQAFSNFRIFDEMDALNAQPAFVPGSLTLVASPSGADISATSNTGGTKGTGVIDIRNLSLPVNGEVLIQFDITLANTLANGTVVTNQSTLRLANGTDVLSDDPNVNGTANSNVSGDEDPTKVKIASAPAFRVQKISTDMTSDPNVLLAGETLRYVITAKNISKADAVNVTLRDAVPANTTYVAGSTTLNGTAVADVAGLSPLVNGMLINSPANTTPGSMPADASSSQANVATITFDVVVNANTANGTLISNQGFVSAVASGIVDYPSDDPDTPTPDDPTIDIVGNKASLYAEKSVALSGDLGSPGIVDPGDVLRYTITVKNSAAIAATGVVLTDSVPANTTYVANSTVLNGSPFGQPDGGVSPLASGITVGTISPGTTAVLQFDLRVNAGTPAGTVISNQAVVSSTGLPNLLTDGDGNPATGPEPTVVVVGVGQQISITNQVTVVGGGAAVPGAQLEYTVRVANTNVPAINVVMTDDLNGSQPGQLAYVNGSATMNGAAAGVTFSGSTITANYSAVNGPLPSGGTVVLTFRATLNANLALGTVVTNTGVVTWNNPTQTESASVSITVGSIPAPGTPGFGVLSGSVWHDADFDDVQDSGERAMAGWAVELYRDNQLFQSAMTDGNGVYRITDVEPNDVSGIAYELRFRAPGTGANTAMLGRAVSPFTNGLQKITNIIVRSGADLQGMNLAIHPNGVIYNSTSRAPVAGATLTLLDARSASPLPASCFDDAAQQGQITLADGYYKFDVNFNDPACTSGGDYLIGVTAPAGSNYVAGYSQIIPPTSNASTAAFSVPACPSSAADKIPGTAQFCEVQPSEFAPASSVPARSAGTTYHVHLMLDGSQTPGSSQIFNNHIPVDPLITGSLAISKSTPLLNVTRGQLVPYVITVRNPASLLLTDVSIVDRLPAGFSYVAGSALLDGVPTEPSVVAGVLSWNGLRIAGTEARTLRLLVAVGAGVTEGEYINRAQVMAGVTGGAMSGEATATVRLMPDLTFDCTDVTGKVFNDANRNGLQDGGEEGLSGVRVVTPRGLQATTDKYGRYHISCAITPNESRGSNFVLKLDDRTLPSGFRMSTNQVQIKRATRGKTLQLNFGASINRVVAIDLSDAVFEPGKTDIRVQWRPRLNLLLQELSKSPAVLRLSYVADTEDASLVQQRVEALKRQLSEAWGTANYSYTLTIEPEVFWRRGAPPKRPDVPKKR